MNNSSLIKTLLIIDDDQIFAESVKDEFTTDSFMVFTACNGAEGLDICSKNKVDVVLLDQNLPDLKGDTLCQPILKYNEQCKIIFITAFPSFNNAVQAIKEGAYDYLSKPFELEELHLSIKNVLKINDLEKIKQYHNYRSTNEKKENKLVGNWDYNDEIPNLIKLASQVDSPVLITGETGTGKSIIAKKIHYSSFKTETPFISLNCAALPETLIETELFGYEKGAFTGAVSKRKGIFEIAEGGTLLLDEIGAMPLHLQSKLLGVLDDGMVRRVGGHSFIRVKVRIIAATNSNLEKMIKEKTFREDLYFRLSVLRLHIPPLQERPGDIPALCKFFIDQNKHSGNHFLSNSELEKLQRYNWPGNVRELKNIIERSILLHNDVLYPSKFISVNDSANISIEPKTIEDSKRIKTLEEKNIEYITQILHLFSENYTRTAKVLGISLSTLKRKIKSHNILSPVQNELK